MGKPNTLSERATFVIEDGIPLPPARGGGRNGSGRKKDPDSFAGALRRMEVGQSIFGAGMRIGLHSQTIHRLAPKKFAVRSVDGGIRIWRIS